MTKNAAYVTMLFNDGEFTQGVIMLKKSLTKVKAKYPLICMITSNVSQQTIEELVLAGVACRTVPEYKISNHIASPEQVMPGQAEIKFLMYTKLNVWTFEEFDKLIYVDADMLVLQNMDHLADRKEDFLAVPDTFDADRFNAGFLVLTPSNNTFKDMISKANILPSYEGGDQGFLNLYFDDWFNGSNRLPLGYNWAFLQIRANPGYYNYCKQAQKIYAIHFWGPWKLWKMGKGADVNFPLELSDTQQNLIKECLNFVN